MEKGEGQRLGVDRLLAKWALEEGIIERKEDGEYRLCAGNGMGGPDTKDSISVAYPESLKREADDSNVDGGADDKMDVDG
jgi:hypothetical protein